MQSSAFHFSWDLEEECQDSSEHLVYQRGVCSGPFATSFCMSLKVSFQEWMFEQKRERDGKSGKEVSAHGARKSIALKILGACILYPPPPQDTLT